jgi:hypothetical protein
MRSAHLATGRRGADLPVVWALALPKQHSIVRALAGRLERCPADGLYAGRKTTLRRRFERSALLQCAPQEGRRERGVVKLDELVHSCKVPSLSHRVASSLVYPRRSTNRDHHHVNRWNTWAYSPEKHDIFANKNSKARMRHICPPGQVAVLYSAWMLCRWDVDLQLSTSSDSSHLDNT